jgi:hypothetical protein
MPHAKESVFQRAVLSGERSRLLMFLLFFAPIFTRGEVSHFSEHRRRHSFASRAV